MVRLLPSRVRASLAVALSCLIGLLLMAPVLARPDPGELPLATEGDAVAGHLVISEVTTGGASAADEFVELYNPTAQDLDPGGLELVYASASGLTVTRKAAWDAGSAAIPAGRHLLIANAAGSFAALADATYANGLAATGGSVALRAIDTQAVVDAVGWGSATAWFEGSPAPAPPAGSSLERLPGGASGSGQDTDDNASDFLVRDVAGSAEPCRRSRTGAGPVADRNADPELVAHPERDAHAHVHAHTLTQSHPEPRSEPVAHRRRSRIARRQPGAHRRHGPDGVRLRRWRRLRGRRQWRHCAPP